MVESREDGRRSPVVMDFGLARDSTEGQGLTESGAVMGTPAYMAPEQARGDVRAIDRRSDVYSLGATLYEVITGTPPFAAASVVELLLKVLNEEVLPLRTHLTSVPPDLETIVLKCLNKEPSQRYDSAKALAEDLGRYLSGDPIVGRRVGFGKQILRRVRKHRGLVAVGGLSLLVVLGLGTNLLRQRAIANSERVRAAEQARLERDLSQQIKDMEWLLRSARQLSIHDLGREKVIVRQRMTQLQAELGSYGAFGRSLAHYALGRGHMALHEYPQALAELQQAIAQGNQSAEAQYALGFVLGKHFEQAIYDARLSGSGDWTKRQLKEIEPKYLEPAIASLQRSRAMKFEAPGYLEGLIAFYKRDFQAALRLAEAALKQAPWLYEASKLTGDVHLELALQARERNQLAEAKTEFMAAVRSYREAAAEGRSDAEVYEGLAEAWLRQVEMASLAGEPNDEFYAAAVAASDQILVTEPQSVSGLLKKAFAFTMASVPLGNGKNSDKKLPECLLIANAVLQKQPANPYASELAAGCYLFASEVAQAGGENPEPLFLKAANLLERALQQSPRFLWGLNDLGVTYGSYGAYLRLTGRDTARKYQDKAIEYFTRAKSLDSSYLAPIFCTLFVLGEKVATSASETELRATIARAETESVACQSVDISRQCPINFFLLYVKASARMQLAEKEPQRELARAFATLAELRKVGGSFLEVEQHEALARLVEARSRVRHNVNPAPSLTALQASLHRCFAIAAKDAMCRTVAAQADWVAADWLTLHNKSTNAVLLTALGKAQLATQGRELFPDAWQVLAETYLRLAGSSIGKPAVTDRYLADGFVATQKLFIINPNHGLGWATQGALQLMRALLHREPGANRLAAQSAVAAFEQALRNDVLLTHDYAPLLAKAQALTATTP